ncbi:nucleoside diphosphate kinase [Hyaloraphidium curvatum]|nr:nucleoside diphosphate kinase [Hyaloraphidium curvatum]
MLVPLFFVLTSLVLYLSSTTVIDRAEPRISSIQQAFTAAPYVEMAGNAERTYIMVKPDGVERGLVGEIVKRFEQRGYKLLAIKMVKANEDLLKEHYGDLSSKPFFPKLINYMSSGPVVGMVWQGKAAVKTGRFMLGTTNPLDSPPGSIRGDYCIDVGKNIVHGSDSVESAEKEIALWFPEGVTEYKRSVDSLIYE